MMQPRLLKLAAGALAVIAITGCQPSSQSTHTPLRVGVSVRRTGQPEVDVVSGEDAAMNAAIARARASVGTFIAALKAPRAGQKSFAIQKRFASGRVGEGEHMWIVGLSFDGSLFHGFLNNVPVNVRGIKQGDAVTCAPSELSDWMFTDKGKLVGGTTIRVLYDRLPPAEKKQLEKESGYRF